MIQKLFSKKTESNLPLVKINDKKVIFIHINKTGGTSIYNALGLKNKIHITARHIIDQIGEDEWKNAYKLSFVRNPWDKVVSHYKYKVKTNKQNLKVNTLSFKEWVMKTYGNNKDYYYFNNPIMFQPQLDWLVDHKGNIDINFIGKFEHIEEDFQKLCAHLGIEKKLPHLNSTSKDNYKDFYDDTTKEMIAHWFKKDIEKFKYEF